jgi:hypothetical protein
MLMFLRTARARALMVMRHAGTAMPGSFVVTFEAPGEAVSGSRRCRHTSVCVARTNMQAMLSPYRIELHQPSNPLGLGVSTPFLHFPH